MITRTVFDIGSFLRDGLQQPGSEQTPLAPSSIQRYWYHRDEDVNFADLNTRSDAGAFFVRLSLGILVPIRDHKPQNWSLLREVQISSPICSQSDGFNKMFSIQKKHQDLQKKSIWKIYFVELSTWFNLRCSSFGFVSRWCSPDPDGWNKFCEVQFDGRFCAVEHRDVSPLGGGPQSVCGPQICPKIWWT